MTLLSTSSHLIRVGKEYSAGSGISINDYVISVTGGTGTTYSAGDNIEIYKQDEQLYISSKDWTNDIANASANAYNAATAQIPEPQDLSYISSKVDDKLDSTAFTNWQTGQYTTDLQTIEGQITNKLDTSSFAEASGNFQPKGDYAERDFVLSSIESSTSGKLDVSSFASVSSDFLTTSFEIPESATWNEVSTTVQSNSAQWAEGGSGDEEVNSFVYNNSATINEVNTTYQSNSASYLTAHQDISNKLDTTAFSTVSGDFLTDVDLTPYQTTAGMTAYQSAGDYVEKSSINTITGDNGEFVWTAITGIDNVWISASEAAYASRASTAQNASRADIAIYSNNAGNSEHWYGASSKLDKSAFSDVSGSFLTAVNITESANWNETTNVVQTNSANWKNETISSYTSAYSYDIPPYGGYVINSLNGKFLSAFISKNADNAKVATNANTATYAQTVDETKLENDGFAKNLSSEYGTISVVRNTIESTNSAIARTGNEGFVSSFNNESIGPSVTANFSWDKSLPNTTFNFTESYASTNTTITYSANTNLTGEVTVTYVGEIPFSVEVPNATELNVWANDWIQIKNNVASAADSFETVFGELAWASALPTYEYDSTNKISAINGSAIAAGDEFPASADEAITAYQNNSATYLTAHQAISADEWNNCYDNVNTNSGAWGGSALPISAGPGIKVNLVDNTLVFSNDETLLWTTGSDASITSFTLNEPISSFDRIRFKAALFNTTEKICGEIAPDIANPLANISFSVGGYVAGEDGNPYQWYGTRYSTLDGLTYNRIDNKWIHMTLTGTTFTYNSNGEDRCIMLREIVGINRK